LRFIGCAVGEIIKIATDILFKNLVTPCLYNIYL
jgi:hypothetical protein